MSKRWHKFNFREWRSDEKLRRCDRDVQAIWLDLCGLIYEAEDMGRLSVEEDGVRRPYTRSELCRLTGDDPRVMNRALSQLVKNRVCEEEGGYLVSRRIAREELKAQLDASNGAKGGNPSLKDKALGEKGVNPQKPETQKPDFVGVGSASQFEVDGRFRLPDSREGWNELGKTICGWANGSLTPQAAPSEIVLQPVLQLLNPPSGPRVTLDDVRVGIMSTAAQLHAAGRTVKTLGYFKNPIIEARDTRLKPNPEVSNERAGQSQSKRDANGRGGHRQGAGGKHGASPFGAAWDGLFGGDQAPTDVSFEPIDGRNERVA